ncbi:DUF3108 domain-containing protein [Kistimonas asteriae]|uniref:DUF3108 domain-containing protein n=1 Tax=Kistimonas asteriae TaxID=517724 RepID=UPI001BAABCC4|nr:DUF3108 domain-containing protein [Kistimonas asteriae]
MKHLLLASLLAFAPTTGMAATQAPLAFEASYSATMGNIPMDGTAERKLLRQPDGTWQLTFNAEMLFYSFSEQSRFTLDENNRIQPISYQLKKGALGKDRQASVKFDWKRKQADSREDNDQWELAIQPGDLDKISYQLQLQEDMRQGRKDLHYQVVNEDERDDYQFLVENEETLQTPLGPVKTIRLKMQRDNNKRQTWIWLAKEWNYMLVKLRQVEKNKEYVISLKEASIEGKALEPTHTVKK